MYSPEIAESEIDFVVLSQSENSSSESDQSMLASLINYAEEASEPLTISTFSVTSDNELSPPPQELSQQENNQIRKRTTTIVEQETLPTKDASTSCAAQEEIVVETLTSSEPSLEQVLVVNSTYLCGLFDKYLKKIQQNFHIFLFIIIAANVLFFAHACYLHAAARRIGSPDRYWNPEMDALLADLSQCRQLNEGMGQHVHDEFVRQKQKADQAAREFQKTITEMQRERLDLMTQLDVERAEHKDTVKKLEEISASHQKLVRDYHELKSGLQSMPRQVIEKLRTTLSHVNPVKLHKKLCKNFGICIFD